MKALVISSDKRIDIVEKPIPVPKSEELLIRVSAVALNKRDKFISQGLYPGIQFGSTLGSDGVGEVVQAGANANPSWIGKRVLLNPNINWGKNENVQSIQYSILGMPTDGTFAEYVVVHEDRVHEVPSHLTNYEAAALPLAGLTAYRASFFHGKINQKSNVLISGFGGGVAQYAFQFSKAVGANVFITSGSEEKRNKALVLGAKEAYDYHDEQWIKKAEKSTGGIDVVIDSAGGDQINNFIKIMRAGGRIVFYGATNGLPKSLDLYRMFWNQITLQGSTMGNDHEFEELLSFISKHKITPIIDSVRPFSEIMTAFSDIDDSSKLGKLVIEL